VCTWLTPHHLGCRRSWSPFAVLCIPLVHLVRRMDDPRVWAGGPLCRHSFAKQIHTEYPLFVGFSKPKLQEQQISRRGGKIPCGLSLNLVTDQCQLYIHMVCSFPPCDHDRSLVDLVWVHRHSRSCQHACELGCCTCLCCMLLSCHSSTWWLV
jgi:hypothetical protein